MRRKALFAGLGALALVAACKHSGSAKLEGRWKGVRAEGISADRQEAANAFAASSEIVARGNQILLSTPHGKGPQATYFVDGEEKGTLVIHTDKDGPTQKETFVFGEDGKSLVWRMGDGRSILFQKVGDK